MSRALNPCGDISLPTFGQSSPFCFHKRPFWSVSEQHIWRRATERKEARILVFNICPVRYGSWQIAGFSFNIKIFREEQNRAEFFPAGIDWMVKSWRGEVDKLEGLEMSETWFGESKLLHLGCFVCLLVCFIFFIYFIFFT